MTTLFKKLNFKSQPSILCLDAPESFTSELDAMRTFTTIHNDADGLDKIPFAIAFVTTAEEVTEAIEVIGPKLEKEAVVWFCYPKKSSKKYSATITRDQGWSAMADYDLEPVRQVAIDEDWSALRFKPVDQIKTMTRRKSMTLTEKGKNKTKPSDGSG